jgi:hypothetical protein
MEQTENSPAPLKVRASCHAKFVRRFKPQSMEAPYPAMKVLCRNFGNILPLAALALVSCGGGSSGGSQNNPGTGTPYAFIAPILNSMRTYSETIVDNANNTIAISFSDTVMTVNADGTYVVLFQPSNPSVIVNGTNYGGPPETQTYNTSGQETVDAYTSDSTAYTCNFDPHGTGPAFPVQVGMSWSLDYTYSCNGGAATSYMQSGTVSDVESVTVPAGTFSAIKLQSTLTWTDGQGTTRTQTITNWRDVATSISVKQEFSVAYSGTLPTTGYAVSREILLESIS